MFSSGFHPHAMQLASAGVGEEEQVGVDVESERTELAAGQEMETDDNRRRQGAFEVGDADVRAAQARSVAVHVHRPVDRRFT